MVDESHVINLVESETNVEHFSRYESDYNLYPLRFEIQSKYLKKLVGDIAPFSEVFTVEKIGNKLQFTYKNISNTIKGYNICKDLSKFDLQSTLSADAIFSVSTSINYIKPLANSLISEKIKIYVDSTQDMVFNTSIDEGAVDLLMYISINRL
jgi:hypothetical protein